MSILTWWANIERSTVDEVLSPGMFGFKTTTGELKLGDGATAFSALPVVAAAPVRASGSVSLVTGTKAVANTAITAASKIRVFNMGVAGTAGALSVALSAGVGFTINSTSATDASSIYYEIVTY